MEENKGREAPITVMTDSPLASYLASLMATCIVAPARGATRPLYVATWSWRTTRFLSMAAGSWWATRFLSVAAWSWRTTRLLSVAAWSWWATRFLSVTAWFWWAARVHLGSHLIRLGDSFCDWAIWRTTRVHLGSHLIRLGDSLSNWATMASLASLFTIISAPFDLSFDSLGLFFTWRSLASSYLTLNDL